MWRQSSLNHMWKQDAHLNEMSLLVENKVSTCGYNGLPKKCPWSSTHSGFTMGIPAGPHDLFPKTPHILHLKTQFKGGEKYHRTQRTINRLFSVSINESITLSSVKSSEMINTGDQKGELGGHWCSLTASTPSFSGSAPLS